MITRVRLTEDDTRKIGIKPCDFRDLGRVVVLSGPNGSGKTRFLETITSKLGHAFARPNVSSTDVEWTEVPKNTWYVDTSAAVTQHFELVMPSRSVGPRGLGKFFAGIAESRRSRLESYAKALFNARHQDLVDDEAVQKLGRDAIAFSDTLTQLLGTKLTFGVVDTSPKPKLFDRFYEEKELSAGQQLLVVWALLLHHDASRPEEGYVVFIDEPERNLHPSSAITILEMLSKAIGKHGQLWIATHSPSILAHYGRESLYCVENGSARYAGSRVDEIMNSLLGGPDNRRNLSDFLVDAEQLNFLKYAVDALFGPGVASHADGDRQESQFARLVSGIAGAQASKLRILDYAAGAGRFAVALAEMQDNLIGRIEYFAFNDRDHDEYHSECVRSVARLHPDDADVRVTTEPSDFFGDNRVHLVVMSNFLHEIDPRRWQDHFTKAQRTLREDGLLIVIEDQEPSVGELPTPMGLFVLDLEAMRVLFGHDPNVRSLSNDRRLSAIAVPYAQLSRFSVNSLREAMEATKVRARKELSLLREASGSGSAQSRGRRHAFYMMLLASTQMLLDDLPGTMTSP